MNKYKGYVVPAAVVFGVLTGIALSQATDQPQKAKHPMVITIHEGGPDGVPVGRRDLVQLNWDGKLVGRLTVEDGKLVFIGDADKSAKLFFDMVSKEYLECEYDLSERLKPE